MTIAAEPRPEPGISTGDRFYRHALVLALVAALGFLLYALVRPFFTSLVWALLLAFLLSPVNHRVRGLYRGKRGWAAMTVTLLVLFCLAIPTALLAANFVVQGIELVQRLSAADGSGRALQLPWVAKLTSFLEAHLPVQANQIYASAMSKLSGLFSSIVTVLLGIATGIVNGVASLVITLTILFFALRDGDGVATRVLGYVPLRQLDKDRLVAQTAAVTRASVGGSLVTAVVQGALIGLGFLIAGLPSPVVFGVLAGFMSLLPVVGTAAVWVPGAIVLALQHRWGWAVFLALWGLLLVGLADNVVRPLFVSGKAELPTLAVLLGVLGGISAFGFVGTFLGPVIFSVALSLIRLAPPAAEPPPLDSKV
jgi:predicted PurR-regulated permease PerM